MALSVLHMEEMNNKIKNMMTLMHSNDKY